MLHIEKLKSGTKLPKSTVTLVLNRLSMRIHPTPMNFWGLEEKFGLWNLKNAKKIFVTSEREASFYRYTLKI